MGDYENFQFNIDGQPRYENPLLISLAEMTTGQPYKEKQLHILDQAPEDTDPPFESKRLQRLHNSTALALFHHFPPEECILEKSPNEYIDPTTPNLVLATIIYLNIGTQYGSLITKTFRDGDEGTIHRMYAILGVQCATLLHYSYQYQEAKMQLIVNLRRLQQTS